jgi:hypothetical protein
MTRRKKRFARAQRFTKRYHSIFEVLKFVLPIIISLIVGQRLVILETVTVHRITLNQTDAIANGVVTQNFAVFGTITIKNATGTFELNAR